MTPRLLNGYRTFQDHKSWSPAVCSSGARYGILCNLSQHGKCLLLAVFDTILIGEVSPTGVRSFKFDSLPDRRDPYMVPSLVNTNCMVGCDSQMGRSL